MERKNKKTKYHNIIIKKMVKIKQYLMKFFRKYYLYFFKRAYVRKSLKARKGSCKQCGSCCYNFGIRCPFLTKDNKCRVHKHKRLLGKFCPFFTLCRISPFDEKQQIIGGYKDKCGFYWEKKKPSKKRKTRKSKK